MQRIRKISESLTGGNPQNNPPPPRPAIGRPQKLHKRGRRLSDAAADVVASVRNKLTRTESDSFLGEQARNKLRRKSSDSLLNRPGSALKRTPSIQRFQQVASRQSVDKERIGSPEPLRTQKSDDWEEWQDKIAREKAKNQSRKQSQDVPPARLRKQSQDLPPPRQRKMSQNAETAPSNSKLGPVTDCRPLDRAATRKPGAPRELFNVATSSLCPPPMPQQAPESPSDVVYTLPPNPEGGNTSLQRKSRMRTQQREIPEHSMDNPPRESTRSPEVPARATTPLGRRTVSNQRMFAPSEGRSSGHSRRSPPKVEEVDVFKRQPSAEPSAPRLPRQTSHPPSPAKSPAASRHASSYVPEQPRPEPRQRSATAPSPVGPRPRRGGAADSGDASKARLAADPWDAVKNARLYAWLDDTAPRAPGAPPPVPPKTAIYNPFVSRTRSVYSSSSVASPTERAAPPPPLRDAQRAPAQPVRVVVQSAEARARGAEQGGHRAAAARESMYPEVEYVHERAAPAPKPVRDLRRGDAQGGSTRSKASTGRTDSYYTAVEGEAQVYAKARR